MRLLLVEDNHRLADLVTDAFTRESFTIDPAGSLDDASAALRAASYDAIILDLGLPDGDGLAFLRQLRQSINSVPVLILSARERLEDRLAGLSAGADDYLAKPFAMAELLARVRALLRRPPSLLPNCYTFGNLAMDETTLEIVVDGKRIELPRRERAILRLLIRQPGRLVLRSAMDNSVFGFDSEVGSNALEVYMHRLRKRLQQASANVSIRTEKGMGYSLEKVDV